MGLWTPTGQDCSQLVPEIWKPPGQFVQVFLIPSSSCDLPDLGCLLRSPAVYEVPVCWWKMCAVDLESVNDVFTVLCGVWVLSQLQDLQGTSIQNPEELMKAQKVLLHLQPLEQQEDGLSPQGLLKCETSSSALLHVISLVAFWLHGYAFAFGEHNSFIGGQFFLTLDGTNMAHFFFNYVRCAVATTVALGAVNERTEPIGYLISGYVFAGFVYPIACHWVWDQQGIFSSGNSSFPVQVRLPSLPSSLFFLQPASRCLLGFVLPTLLSTSIPGEQRADLSFVVPLSLCSQLTALGSFMQMVGFLGLVLGSYSSVAALREGQMAALCVVNVLLAGATAGLYSLVIMRMHRNYYDLDNMLRAAIAGMVRAREALRPGVSLDPASALQPACLCV
ncbi:AMT1 protein, partial [Atractosteus spatula]|nr:AMT1 protein [Atractosteus spatula]